MLMTNPFLKERKRFSIISPCYKEDWKHLEKNANTLAEQEYQEFEWIVVFDGSNKRGERMMAVLKESHKFPISWYTIKHGGAPKARNFGASKATGDYFCFLNADNFLYPEALRMWSDAFEDPTVNRVWGLYDVETKDGRRFPVGQVPLYPDGSVWYKAFKYTNYCDSTFPIRRESFIKWNDWKALQDWDWAIRQLKRDNFQGKDWRYLAHSFFVAEDAEPGGLSDYSHKHWWELTGQIREKNNIPRNDICVVSLGAAHHGFHIAEKLGADYLPMPSFKDHKYKMIYLIGFYTAEDPANPITTQTHMQVFAGNKGKSVIHWIGTDILQMHWNNSFEKIKAIKQWMKDEKVINLTEIDYARKELLELGIKSKIIPIPSKKLNDPMPLPKKFSVAIYESSVSPMYNTEFMETIVRSMPDIKFYFFGDPSKKGQQGDNYEHLGYIDMDEWMPKFSMNLRISVHDGYPLLPLEFLTAGRNVALNVKIGNGSIYVKKDRKAVINAIRYAQKHPLNPKWSKIIKKQMDFKLYKNRIRHLL